MKAIILAAGKGSRMGRLTKNTHKTLLKINGKSLLTKIVEDLRNLNIITSDKNASLGQNNFDIELFTLNSPILTIMSARTILL